MTGSGWRVERTTDAAAFLAAAEPLLAREPVLGTVVTSVASRRADADRRGDPRPDHPFWFAVVRGPDGAPAGAAMRTADFAPHPAYVLSMPDDGARALADDVLARREVLLGLNGVQRPTRVVAEALARATGAEVVVSRPTRLHELGTLVEPRRPPGAAREPRDDELGLVVAWFTAFHDDADRQAGREPSGVHGEADPEDVGRRVAEGRVLLWADPTDRPVSLAATNPAVHGVARIGPVYTPPADRGRGYAAAVVATASRRLQDDGARACLFTDLENPVSNRLYERLGYRPVADLAELAITGTGAGTRLLPRLGRAMTDQSDDAVAPRLASTLAEAEDALLSRWPETRLEPSLDRIRAFVDLLGEPQRAYEAIHLTGTNGKTSTSRMVDDLLRALELRTGRFTSPHVEQITERISIDGEPLTDEAFVRAFNDVAPLTHLVDADQPHPLSFFETVVAMAYAAFADAPVDVAVVEVGMGGSWDATNVIDAAVAVVTPIAVDHAQYLGTTPAAIAREKAGVIKAGATAVVARQPDDVLAVLRERAAEVGATLLLEDVDFGVVDRVAAVGGQVVTLQGLRARYEEVFLPLHGAHQAQNAAVALAAVEAFAARERPLGDDVVRAAFAEVTSPGRLEVVRTSPTIVLDAAHNPAGAEAVAAAIEDSFRFGPLVGVVGVMGDKDHEGLLAALEPVLAHVVCTQSSAPRALPADRLAETAVEVFGDDRVSVAPSLPDALDEAAALAEAGDGAGDPLGSGAVLVTGSVVTVGEARGLLRRAPAGSAGGDR